MSFEPCRHCKGTRIAGRFGPRGEQEPCCDGGTWWCDECQCEIEDIDGLEPNDDSEHLCPQCREERELDEQAEELEVYTEECHVQWLNELSPDYDSDEWIIGGKNRRDEFAADEYGEAMRKHDPIAFNVSYQERQREIENQ